MNRVGNFHVVITSALLLLSCGGGGSTSDPTSIDQAAQLDANRSRWQASGVHNYRYTFKKNCFCAPAETGQVRITVVNDVIVEVVNTADNSAVPANNYQAYFTVDQGFALIDDAIKRGAERVTVNYDSLLGYPMHINIDYTIPGADHSIGADYADLIVL